MKNSKTEIVFILDRSGSMSGLESDTIGGFNAMLKKQQKLEGEAVVTTVLFDDKYELLHDRFNLQDVRELTYKEYYVKGSTALLDAVGISINKIVDVQRNTADAKKAGKVLFVIITDGLENSSREYTAAQVKQMIEVEKEKYGWEFIFLGANIDAIATARSYGIDADRAVNYHADSKGTTVNYESVGEAISELRTSSKISKQWKKKSEADYMSRS